LERLNTLKTARNHQEIVSTTYSQYLYIKLLTLLCIIALSVNMSAPNQGRQSPEPERQTDAQTGATTESGKLDESSKKDEGKDDQTSNLSSNPTHPLEQAAKEKSSKTVQ
jgi:hypothetical protein